MVWLHWRALLFKSAVTLVLLFFLAWAERPALGDFLRLEPTADIDAMKAGNVPFSLDNLARDDERLALVARIDPTNPVVPEYQAQIALIQARVARLDPLQSAGYLALALDDYRHALALRPNSGYLWAGRMTAASALSQAQDIPVPALRAEALQAMVHAVTLAPWEDAVLREVVSTGHDIGLPLTAEQQAALALATQHWLAHGNR